MKTFKKISYLLFLIISIHSCDEANDALNKIKTIDISNDFSETITIDIPELSTTEQSFSEITTIDIASNEQIQENLDLIEDVTINTITYEISNFTGSENAIVEKASIDFNDTSINISDINLKNADDNNTIFTIDDTSILNTISSILQDNTEIDVTLTGVINTSPVVFDITFNVDTTVAVETTL